MEPALTGAIGMPSHQDHRRERRHEGDDGHRTERQPRCAGDIAQQPGQPEEHAVVHDGIQEEHTTEKPYLRAGEAVADRRMTKRFPRGTVGGHGCGEPAPVVRRQPAGLVGSIGHHFKGEESQKNRRQPFNQEEPLPAFEAERAVECEERLRQRRTDNDGDRRRHHEQRARACAVGGGNPVRQVKHYPWEEPGLGDAEQDARRHERRDVIDEDRPNRDDAPADHDAGNPAACPDTLEEEVAGDLEQAVAEEEQAGADTVLSRAEAEVALELARGEADVHSVDVGHDVANESERDQPAADAAQHDAGAVGTFAGACFRGAKHRSGTLPRRCRPTNSRVEQPSGCRAIVSRYRACSPRSRRIDDNTRVMA